MIFDVLKASSNHVKVQGWEWADMFVVCICVLQWLHIGEVIVCVCALQWFRMSFDHWVSAVCLCGPLPIGVNFSYLKWRQCGEEKRCYGVLKQEVWSGETLCERCRLKRFWHPPHWSTVTVLLWLGCQKWQTHLFFFGVLRSAHVEKKRFFKMGIVETCHTHKFYRHLFFWIIYFFPFETSATASCGYTGIDVSVWVSRNKGPRSYTVQQTSETNIIDNWAKSGWLMTCRLFLGSIQKCSLSNLLYRSQIQPQFVPFHLPQPIKVAIWKQRKTHRVDPKTRGKMCESNGPNGLAVPSNAM